MALVKRKLALDEKKDDNKLYHYLFCYQSPVLYLHCDNCQIGFSQHKDIIISSALVNNKNIYLREHIR